MAATDGTRAAANAGLDAAIPAISADGSLFSIGKLEAHRLGQKHLAVSVFVFAGERLLIQQRADGKYHSGGLWANTCCTHPHWNESPADCARRRMMEELGFELPLTARAVVDYEADVGKGLTENERVHIFRGDLARPIEISGFNRDEVQAVSWIGEHELRLAVVADPSRFTPWLRIYLDRWSELALRPAA